jgi:hypothetical protein
MIDFKKYKRFFSFGCSLTSYYWPTWADVIAQEIPESYNYGQSGGGNLFIASQVVEANTRYKFNEDDLVIVMWSSVAREDRWVKGQWLTPGNIYTQNYYDQKFIDNFSDCKGYLIRDLAVITMCKGFLDSLKIDYHMLSMAPFMYMQFTSSDQKFDNGEGVLEFYKETLDSVKPDILTVECNGRWPQHPIKGNGKGQTADYHPDTAAYANYLKKIFPGIKFKSSTLEFIQEHQTYIQQAQHLDDLKTTWLPTRPQRL